MKICAEDFVPKSKKVAVSAAAESVPQFTAAEGHKIPAKRIKTDIQVVTLGFNVVPGEISVGSARVPGVVKQMDHVRQTASVEFTIDDR